MASLFQLCQAISLRHPSPTLLFTSSLPVGDHFQRNHDVIVSHQKLKLCPRPLVRPIRRRSSQLEASPVQITNALGFGILSPRPPDATNSSLLPSADARCACASNKTYGKCCRRYHTAQMLPQQAEDLLRSRYSAYAYRLPSYIMKTTHSSAIELDRRMWRREIMNFCKEYQFVGGVDIVETQMPAPYTTRILFRANLMQGNSQYPSWSLLRLLVKGIFGTIKAESLLILMSPVE